MTAWGNPRKEVFGYFDHDAVGYAAQNALTLKEILA
jgi:hypothetical protein